MKRIVFRVALVILAALSTSCPSLFKTPLPDELLGSWTYGYGSGYYRYTATYTFRQYDFDFSETAASMNVYNEGYTDDVEEVFLAEEMFRTPDNTHYWWHVVGNLCYFGKTNPGDPKPTLAANWWVGSSPMTKQ